MYNKWNVHINHFGILILGFVYISSVESTYWTPNLYQNITRFRRQTNSNCQLDEFTCKDRSCILDQLYCNGKDDCGDGSDETLECKNIQCNPLYGFRCAYGACVGRKAKCNGIKDCKDNSDERDCHGTTNSCVVTQFTCRSGECIDDQLLCNGAPDCPDNSDETEEECAGINCFNYFRCKYGACVPKNVKCNGVSDCVDGSDELNCPNIKPIAPKPVTESPKRPDDGSCVIPSVPANGVFVKGGNRLNTYKPGEYVSNYHALVVKCNNKFKTSPPNKNYPICLNGNWNSPPLQCVSYCSSAISTKTRQITCKFRNIPLESCVEPVEGTIVNIKCENLYEAELRNPYRICKDGTWDYPILECQPICGQKRPKGGPNIHGGTKAVKGDYPWHIGIYFNDKSKTHICGGSILNRVVIISAAHCFTDYDGNLYNKSNYLIAAGKYYSPYNDQRDTQYAQYATIKEIHIPERYKDSAGFYALDISVVILTIPLTITIAVQPVCVDWNNEFEYQQLSEYNTGIVVGWGVTELSQTSSLELKELNTPYIPYDQCYKQVPKDFRKFLTHDKVCAGFLHKGVSVCVGDSGGGLTFERKFSGRYFLRGVVSTSPRDKKGTSCDPNEYSTYTLISEHIQFIKELEVRHRII